jgi:hypothetical protein
MPARLGPCFCPTLEEILLTPQITPFAIDLPVHSTESANGSSPATVGYPAQVALCRHHLHIAKHSATAKFETPATMGPVARLRCTVLEVVAHVAPRNLNRLYLP